MKRILTVLAVVALVAVFAGTAVAQGWGPQDGSGRWGKGDRAMMHERVGMMVPCV